MTQIGKVSVISYVYFLIIYFFLLIDVFFDVDSKSTIGFRFSAVTCSFRDMKV